MLKMTDPGQKQVAEQEFQLKYSSSKEYTFNSNAIKFCDLDSGWQVFLKVRRDFPYKTLTYKLPSALN